MEEFKLAEWIDQYLLGTIHPEDKARLEELAASDPEVARMLRDSRRAYRVLQSEQRRRLRAKLRAWDRRERFSTRLLPWLVSLSAGILILALAIQQVYMHFAPVAIARKYFVYELAEPVYRHEQAAGWKEATDAFASGRYEEAINDFTAMPGISGEEAKLFVQWNLLMAKLAADGPAGEWKTAMQAFMTASPEAWQSLARQVLRRIESPVFRLFFSSFSAPVSGFKPRII